MESGATWLNLQDGSDRRDGHVDTDHGTAHGMEDFGGHCMTTEISLGS